MSIARTTVRAAACTLAVLVFAGGCGSYYKVTDPTTGRVYYTEELDKRDAGAVTLTDARTGQDVTIQNSEVAKISKEQYETGRVASGRVPGEASARAETAFAEPAPQARPAPPPAQQQQPVARAQPAPAPAPMPQATVAGATVSASANSPAQLRADLVAGKEQIDRTMSALAAVSDPNQPNLQAAYRTYCDELDKLSAHQQRLAAEAEAMRQARTTYFARWDERVSDIDNPTIRAAAEERRTRLRNAQERISTDAGQARDAYRPLMSDLQDVRKFLDGDLSKDTTAVLGPATTKAQKDAQVVKERIDVVIADLDAVQGAVGSASPSGAR